MADIDIDYLRQWIGREERASETVIPSLVARFNATFDHEYDLSAEVAPLMLHLCLAQPAAPTTKLGPDGHPARGSFLPPVPLPRRMWAGGALEFHGDIRVGETVTRRSIIRNVAAKAGKTGLLCFVTVDHEVTSDGRAALVERQDIVYRGAGPVQLPDAAKLESPPAPAPKGKHCRMVTPSSSLLFRYSALTFNGHRIHYDTPYARDVEGYPGLIVHGPLQSTMLAHFAESIRGRRPARFSFRSLTPLFDTADFILNATPEGEALKLWTARGGGPVAMEARAEW